MDLAVNLPFLKYAKAIGFGQLDLHRQIICSKPIAAEYRIL
jgi:hypothetical protein